MERESFEDVNVANLLNLEFVCIKVDREERPDIDHIYMEVCQALTGSGGWPLTIVMTPARHPFYAATYLPPRSRGGMTGLLELLPRLAKLWKHERETALNAGQEVSNLIKSTSRLMPGKPLANEVFTRAFQQYQRAFDGTFGGFGPAPKFPSPHSLLFLLKYYELNKEQQALQMVEKTLTSMYQGGIYDHIGFGFARYSTDRKWLVPHFEKMLYDNALLAIAYLEAHHLTGNELYGRVASEILTYVLRDMTSPEGGFYSAEDADSEGEEGRFYVWTRDEVMALLGERGKLYCEKYGITEAGNFESKNIPNLINKNIDADSRAALEAERKALYIAREKRIKPLKDDKILSGWNGLMIAAMAIGYRLLKDERYLRAAERAVDFILKQLRRKDGRLLARYRDGEALYAAYAADYAYLIWGLIELHEARSDSKYLKAAQELNADLLRLFWDEKNGGLFFYGEDSEILFDRPKQVYDGAIPSDNAVATWNFLRLARINNDLSLEEKVRDQFLLFGGTINENPTAYSFWLLTALYQKQVGQKIVLP